MIIETVKTLFARDLSQLRKEIESYKNESNLWKVEHDVKNSAGNLCTHLIGNLNAFIGKKSGKQTMCETGMEIFHKKCTS